MVNGLTIGYPTTLWPQSSVRVEKFLSGHPCHSWASRTLRPRVCKLCSLRARGHQRGTRPRANPAAGPSGSRTHRPPGATAGARVWDGAVSGKWSHSSDQASRSGLLPASAAGVQQEAIPKAARGAGSWTALSPVPQRAPARPPPPFLGTMGW